METIARRNLVKTAAVAGAAVVAGSVAAAPLAHAAEETASVEELAQKLLAMEECLWDLEAKEAIRYKLRTAAGKSSPLTRWAALSASSRLSKGPTRTRMRLPSLVSATCV